MKCHSTAKFRSGLGSLRDILDWLFILIIIFAVDVSYAPAHDEEMVMVWPKLRSGPESDQTTHVSSKLALGCLILSHQLSQLDHNPVPVLNPKLFFFQYFCLRYFVQIAPNWHQAVWCYPNNCVTLTTTLLSANSGITIQKKYFTAPRSGVVPN